MKKLSEAEFAKHIIEYLEGLNWDIYQEVQTNLSMKCADIVAAQGYLTWIIECKTSCSLQVLEQAWRWKTLGISNYVSIAVPKAPRIVIKICKMIGIGILTYLPDQLYRMELEILKPSIIRKSSKKLRKQLKPEHKHFAKAGNADGKRWTPFKSTCLDVLRVVKNNPGISLKDLVTKINHHYANNNSAKQCLSLWIDKGIVPGVEKRIDGKYISIYPVEKLIIKNRHKKSNI
jgi:hypothetical protein